MAVIYPNCLDCVHYFITYDARRPYGCRAMGFKSRHNPAQVVLLRLHSTLVIPLSYPDG